MAASRIARYLCGSCVFAAYPILHIDNKITNSVHMKCRLGVHIDFNHILTD